MGLLDDVLGSITGQGDSKFAGGASGGSMASKLMPILMATMASKAGAGGLGGGLGGLLGGGKGGLGRMLEGSQGGASGAGSSGGLGNIHSNLLGRGNTGATDTRAGVPSGSLGGALGGMLEGGALAGALGQLVSSFQQGGRSAAVDSWVGNGSNAPIAPHQVRDALGSDTLDQLSQHRGIPQDDIATQLS